MKFSLSLLIIFFSINSYSQKETNIWYFGENAGIDFNTSPPRALSDGLLSTREGCSTFSDSNGNLLFYSDGTTVYDKNHDIMSYSDGSLANNLRGDSSSTQSGMIVPKPQSSTIFYLFTVDSNQGDNGFNYYTIDMSDGIGKIIDEDGDGIFFNALSGGQASNWSEKVTAVRGSECNEIWVVSVVGNEYHSFKVADNGVASTPVVSNVNSFSEKRGYLKLSPDGSKLANASQGDWAILYDFNNTTGEVSNNETFLIQNLTQDGQPYGLEFSLDSKKLYVSTTSGFRNTLGSPAESYKLFQFDLTQTNIPDTKTIIHRQDANSADFPQGGFRGALQVGPDGKIYVTIPIAYNDVPNGDAKFLDVIENPTANASDIIFTKDAIRLSEGTYATQGLPPFISSLLLPIEIIDTESSTIVNNQDLELCVGENKIIGPEPVTGDNVQYEWSFNDGTNTSIISTDRLLILNNLDLIDSGNYSLKIVLTDLCGALTQYNGEFNLNVFEAAVATEIAAIEDCDDDSSGSNSYDFLNDITPLILGGLDGDIFEVLYFNSLIEANANVRDTDLPNTFVGVTGIVNILFARVNNKDAPLACYDITNFSIAVTEIPSPTQPTIYRLCDDTDTGSDIDNKSYFFIKYKGQ